MWRWEEEAAPFVKENHTDEVPDPEKDKESNKGRNPDGCPALASGMQTAPSTAPRRRGARDRLGCTFRQPSVDAHRDASRFDPSGRVTARRALLGGRRYGDPSTERYFTTTACSQVGASTNTFRDGLHPVSWMFLTLRPQMTLSVFRTSHMHSDGQRRAQSSPTSGHGEWLPSGGWISIRRWMSK